MEVNFRSCKQTDHRPVVSIVIPTFNRAELVIGAIRSVLDQSYQNFEILVVDDGSSDGTPNHIQTVFSDARIRVLTKPNGGPNSARNLGVRNAKGKLIAFLDSDDLWRSSKLQKQVELFELQPYIGVIYCDYDLMLSDGRVVPHSVAYCDPDEDLIYRLLVDGNVLSGSASAVMVRTECIRTVGEFDEALRLGEDLDMWWRLACRYRFRRIAEKLIIVRYDPNVQMVDREIHAREIEVYQSTLRNKLRSSQPSLFKRVAPVLNLRHTEEMAHTRGIGAASRFIFRELPKEEGYLSSQYLRTVLAVLPLYVLRIILRKVSKFLISSENKKVK